MPFPLTPKRRELIDRLLDDLLDMTNEDRAAQMEVLAVRHPRIHRILTRLVKASAEPTGLLGGSISRLARQAANAKLADENQLPQGTRLGPWRILNMAGRGGMGIVYEGERADGAFQMRAAIKLIRLKKRDLETRLLRERELMARLNHPGIARLIDGGETPDGGTYLVMEWIDGDDLINAWRPGQRNVGDTLSAFLGLCDAIAHAHQRLVVHGDIKPGNVRVDGEGRFRLLDFGVSRLLGNSPADESSPQALTPSFAAPELQAGEDVGTPADLWALGALLFWLLTGQKPNQMADGDVAELTRRLPHCPRRMDLASILARACHDDPAQRYASASELAGDLLRYQQGRAVSARPAKPSYLLGRFLGRHRLASTLASAALIGLASLTAFAAHQARLTALERDRAQMEATRATQVSDFLVNLFEQADPGHHLGERLSVYELINLGRDNIETLAEVPDQQALMLATLARVYRALGRPDQATNLARQALNLQAIHDLEWQTATGLTLAEALTDSLQHEDAGQLLEELLSIVETARQTQAQPSSWGSQRHLEILLRQAHLANATSNEAEAIERLAEAEGLLDIRQPGVWHADRYALLGTAYFQSSDYALARLHFEKALELNTVARGPRHPRTLDTANFLAQSLAQLGETALAREQLMRSLAIRQQVLPAGHPLIAYDLSSIGSTYWLERDIDHALDWWERALEARRQQEPPDLAELSTAQNALALGLIETDRLEEAEDLLEEALHNAIKVYGEDHLRVAAIIANQSIPPSRRGQLADALAFQQQALLIRRTVGGERHHHTGHSMASIAGTWLRKGNHSEAQRWLDKAVAVYDDIFPDPEHPQRAMLRRIDEDLRLAMDEPNSEPRETTP